MSKPRLSEASQLYKDHCEARRLAQGTIRGQQCAIAQLISVAGDVRLDNVTSRHVDLLFARMQWAPTTRNNRIGQLRAFFSWARASKNMSALNDPMATWRQQAPPETERLRIPFAKWGMLFDVAKHPQERIVLATGLYLFLRASEQQALRLKDVDLSSNRILVWRSKTKQHDWMPISSELDVELRRWLTWLAETHAPNDEHFLICARRKDSKRENNRWGVSYLVNPERPLHKPSLVVQRILKRAGFEVEKGQGEHTLRRSGARAYFDSLVDQGYDGALRRVQAMLGHRHSLMTEHYLGLNIDRELRNKALAGQPMFPIAETVSIREAATWQSAQS